MSKIAYLFQKGKLHRVPVLMGTNRDEGTILIGLDSNITIRGAFDYYQYQWGPNLAPAVAKLYPVKRIVVLSVYYYLYFNIIFSLQQCNLGISLVVSLYLLIKKNLLGGR